MEENDQIKKIEVILETPDLKRLFELSLEDEFHKIAAFNLMVDQSNMNVAQLKEVVKNINKLMVLREQFYRGLIEGY